MLCTFCSNISLDLLSSSQGYKHHPSCTSLLESIQQGCELCKLIWDTQWKENGGDLAQNSYDIGPLESQITARTVNQTPGNYHRIRYGQERRYDDHRSKLMTAYVPDSGFGEKILIPEVPFLTSVLMIAADADDASSKYVQVRPLAHRLPGSWLPSASGWLKDCLTNHKACSLSSSTNIPPPTRVIDVGSIDDTRDPYLKVSDNEVKEWVTLSHCWGQNQPLRTTIHTLSKHLAALPMADIPPLFRDAVTITRTLRYKYLWIDSLCIIQDSKEDWMREIINMGNIYKHSVFTITADNCRDSTQNILENHNSVKTRYVKQSCQGTAATGERFESVLYTFKSSSLKDDPDHFSHVRQRAWALQESILSPRTLEWTCNQVTWTCRSLSGTLSEAYPSLRPENPSSYDLHYTKSICLTIHEFSLAREKELETTPWSTERDPMQIWYHMLRQFCNRKLSFESDALPAISGIAAEVKRHTGYSYVAGLWEQDIHNGLLWSTETCSTMTEKYVAPTWSWASLRMGELVRTAFWGPTSQKYSGEPQPVFKAVVEVIGLDVVYEDGGDEFSAVSEGRLRVMAPVKSLGALEVRFPVWGDRIPNYADDPSGYKIKENTVTCWLDVRPRDEDGEGEFGKMRNELCEKGVVVVQVAFLDSSQVVVKDRKNNYFYEKFKRGMRDQNWALLLEPMAGRNGEWKRIGVARIADGLINGWETRVLTIV